MNGTLCASQTSKILSDRDFGYKFLFSVHLSTWHKGECFMSNG